MTHPYLRDAFPDILLNPLSVRRDLCGGYFFGLVCTRDFVHGRLSTLSFTATRGGRSLQRAFPRLFACPRQGLRAHMSDTSVPPPVRQRFLPSPLTPCPKVRLKYSPPHIPEQKLLDADGQSSANRESNRRAFFVESIRWLSRLRDGFHFPLVLDGVPACARVLGSRASRGASPRIALPQAPWVHLRLMLSPDITHGRWRFSAPCFVKPQIRWGFR